MLEGIKTLGKAWISPFPDRNLATASPSGMLLADSRSCPVRTSYRPSSPPPAPCCWPLLAPLALADEALRVVAWNLETVGKPGSAP